MQGVVKVNWKEGKLEKVYIRDWGCCADIRLINSVYDVSYDNENVPQFKKIYQSIEFEFTRKPKSFFPEPIMFQVENDSYNLRCSPKVDDTGNYFPKDKIGNVIGLLKKGFKGTALGYSTDESGRVWWYVTIDSQFNVENNVLYMKDLDFPTEVVGWISSNFVKRLN